MVAARDPGFRVVGGASGAAMEALDKPALCGNLAGLTDLEVMTLFEMGWSATRLAALEGQPEETCLFP